MATKAQIRIPGIGSITGKYKVLPSVGHYLSLSEKEDEPRVAKIRAVVWIGPGCGEDPFDNSMHDDSDRYEVVIFGDLVEVIDVEKAIFSD